MSDEENSTPAPRCAHRDVVVDYDHPHGPIEGVLVATLRSTQPSETRPRMTLRNARCVACGVALTRRSLGARTEPGGDCFDERFEWT